MRDEEGPVLIVGCGRSGTTYLKTLLSSHDDLFIPTESLFLSDYLRVGDRLPRRLLRWLFFREPQLRIWYHGPRLEASDVAELIDRVHRREAQLRGARVWGQKTPRFVRDIELFDRSFPNIRWIFVYRDPRAVANSMLKSKRHTYSVVKACNRWLNDNGCWLRSSRYRNGSVAVVSYEELVDDLEGTLNRLWSFLGLRPITKDAVLANAKVEPYEGTGFKMNAIRGGLGSDRGRIAAWERELSQDQIGYIEQRCSALMRELGYAPTGRQVGAFFPLRDRVTGLRDAGIILEYLRRWPGYLFHLIVRKALLRVFGVSALLRGGPR